MLGRASRIKETLPDFCENIDPNKWDTIVWYWVTRYIYIYIYIYTYIYILINFENLILYKIRINNILNIINYIV